LEVLELYQIRQIYKFDQLIIGAPLDEWLPDDGFLKSQNAVCGSALQQGTKYLHLSFRKLLVCGTQRSLYHCLKRF
jgi:hypothetical protein